MQIDRAASLDARVVTLLLCFLNIIIGHFGHRAARRLPWRGADYRKRDNRPCRTGSISSTLLTYYSLILSLTAYSRHV